jgi:hypothetical protein
MPKRSFQERRKETNARYYQNRKAREQGQQSEESDESDGSDIWLG